MARARANARSVRGSINAQVWRELNKLYLLLIDPVFISDAGESPHEFYQAVECGSRQFHGICDATLNARRRLAIHSTRQVSGTRRKDAAHPRHPVSALAELDNPTDLPLANLLWGAVLRSCRAYEAYQRLFRRTH